MSTMSATETTLAPAAHFLNKPFWVAVSPDKLLAELLVNPGHPATSSICFDQISQAMSEAGLPPTAIQELHEIVGENELWVSVDSPLIVARGKAAVDDVPARLEMLLHENSETDETPLSHYNRHHYMIAAPGQPIARIIPRVVGSGGMDVFRKPIPNRQPPDDPFQLGENVSLDADGATVLSKIAGRVRLENGGLWVDPLLDIPGDVDFAVGNVDFVGDVHIHRNVLDLFQVKSNGNVIIDGAVEAAQISAGGNLQVTGGIVGKERGRCSAGANISCKYATNVTLFAGGNIRAQVEIANSRIRCAGLLDIQSGVIVGGDVQASGGIHCGAIGSPAGTPTVVEAGTDPIFRQNFLAQIAEFQRLQKEAHAQREIAVPLLQNQKSLTAAQKETLTELLYSISVASRKVTEIALKLRSNLQAARAAAKPEIFVDNYLHAGSTIRFPDVECTVEQTLSGPLRLSPRKITSANVAVYAVCENGRHAVVLPARPCRDEAMRLALQALESAL